MRSDSEGAGATRVLLAVALIGTLVLGLDLIAAITYRSPAVPPGRAAEGSGRNSRSRASAPSTTSSPPVPPQIVFSRTPTSSRASKVFSVAPDGSDLHASTLPSVPVVQISKPNRLTVYSKTLQFHNDCGVSGCSSGNSSTEAGIAVAELGGSHERLLTNGGYDTEPSFSPDGARIAFIRHNRTAAGQEFDSVAIMNVAGTVQVVLDPPRNLTYDSPTWRPDGHAVAVSRRSLSSPPEGPGAAGIMVVPIDGSPPNEVTAGYYRQLAWSHDGRSIAAVRTRYLQSPWQPGMHSTGDDVWVIPVGGGAPHNATNVAPAREIFGAFCGEYGGYAVDAEYPAWSPDDRRLAFLDDAAHSGQLPAVSDIAVVDADGTHRFIAYHTPPATCPGAAGARTPHVPETVALLGWS